MTKQKQSTLIYAGLATAVILAPPVLWFIANIRGPDAFRRNEDEATGPLSYLVCVALVASALALIVVAIRGRTARELAKLVLLVGSGALVTVVVASGALLTVPRPAAAPLEPTPIIDRTRFSRLYQHFIGSASSIPANSEYIMRRSWQLDEYGIQMRNGETTGRPWGLWEEYGLPMRCFASQYGVGVHRPAPMDLLRDFFPGMISTVRLFPLPFTANVLFYMGLIFALPRIRPAIIARHRRQQGRCVKCGYVLRALPRCPECGRRREDAASGEATSGR